MPAIRMRYGELVCVSECVQRRFYFGFRMAYGIAVGLITVRMHDHLKIHKMRFHCGVYTRFVSHNTLSNWVSEEERVYWYKLCDCMQEQQPIVTNDEHYSTIFAEYYVRDGARFFLSMFRTQFSVHSITWFWIIRRFCFEHVSVWSNRCGYFILIE